MEIERKWLIKGLPSEIYKYKYSADIKQGYISVDPEVRIRSHYNMLSDGNIFDQHYLSIKSNGTLSRMEVEIEISKDNYESLLKLVPYDLISKKYFTYEFAGYTIEMSKVDDQWYYAEVEFKSEEDAKEFVFPFPNLVIKETTNDPEFKMKNYWAKTRISEKKFDHKYTKDNNLTIDEGPNLSYSDLTKMAKNSGKSSYENPKENLYELMKPPYDGYVHD